MHHNCLRQIVGYNFYRDGKVTNEDIRAEALSAYTMETNLELRRCRWLEKVANMGDNRLPRKLFGAFCHGKSRRRGKAKATIQHGYRDTLEKLEASDLEQTTSVNGCQLSSRSLRFKSNTISALVASLLD